MSQNDGIFPNQGATLAVVVFIWLSIVPWVITQKTNYFVANALL